ncbi:MAG: hypothetical protein ACREHC_01165 [Candidatus Levyibacteriota bacterium]
MTSLALLFCLICLVQLAIIILWRKPKRLFKNQKAKKSEISRTILFLFIGMLLLYILFFIQLFDYHKPHPLVDAPYIPTTNYPPPDHNVFSQLGERQTGPIDDLYFLYLSSDKSQTTVTQVAWGLRQEYCKRLCIINLYDNKTAFERDLERVTITDQEKMKEWNKQNYVFVADHYLGYLDAVQDASFSYYPFHDSYYKNAKAGTLDGY